MRVDTEPRARASPGLQMRSWESCSKPSSSKLPQQDSFLQKPPSHQHETLGRAAPVAIAQDCGAPGGWIQAGLARLIRQRTSCGDLLPLFPHAQAPCKQQSHSLGTSQPHLKGKSCSPISGMLPMGGYFMCKML